MFGFAKRNSVIELGVVVLAALVIAAPAAAQVRDPAYAAARATGAVGEKTDGYLGFPSAPGPDTRKVASAINIQRKAVYATRAAASGATVEEYAFTSGCLAISHTTPGEKYQAPDGSWHTRSNEAPLRDNRCP